MFAGAVEPAPVNASWHRHAVQGEKKNTQGAIASAASAQTFPGPRSTGRDLSGSVTPFSLLGKNSLAA